MENMQFYRRLLPETCIDFASENGRQIFKEALSSGFMTCFFKISAQFRTQDEPAFCGLTSLVMALNILEIDPGRVWKGPWRWYHENMLDCCISLDVVKERGINMEQFVCLAKCNNLSARLMCAMDFHSVDKFRDLIKEKVRVDDQVVVISYSRKILKQSGSGHFSPVAGYHAEKDLVLIMDTARFKYPPHWVPLQLLYEAMRTEDTDTGLPRGLIVLSRTSDYIGTLLFRPSCSFQVNITKGSLPKAVWNFSDAWNSWLDERYEDQGLSNESILKEFASNFVQKLLYNIESVPLVCLTLLSNSSVKCNSVCCNLNLRGVPNEEQEKIRGFYLTLIKVMEKLETYRTMCEIVTSCSDGVQARFSKLVECDDVSNGSASSTSCSSSTAKAKQSVCTNNNKKLEETSCSHYPQRSEEICKTVVEKESLEEKMPDKRFTISLKITPANILTTLFLVWPVDRLCKAGTRREWVNAWIAEELKGFEKLPLREEILSLHVKFVEVMNYHLDDDVTRFTSKNRF